MTALKSFPREICSLVCQDPIFERRDLNSICFISHPFRDEARRVLFNRFPFLRGVSRIKSWYLSLKRRPHLAQDVQGLVLFLPPYTDFYADESVCLSRALHMCVNLKELSILSQESQPRPGCLPVMLQDLPFKLTKFVNDYFSQWDPYFAAFLNSQVMLKTLELHSGHTTPSNVSFPYLEMLACPAQFCPALRIHPTRLRLDFQNSTAGYEHDELRKLIFIFPRAREMKSLAIFSKKCSGRRQSSFQEIVNVVSFHAPNIKHLEIHQFLPIQIEKDLRFPGLFHEQLTLTETLVLRLPPGLPKKAGDHPNPCAYVNLRSRNGRRRAAEEITRKFQTLTRLIFIVHDCDYEFRKDRETGIITNEELVTFGVREWALVT